MRPIPGTVTDHAAMRRAGLEGPTDAELRAAWKAGELVVVEPKTYPRDDRKAYRAEQLAREAENLAAALSTEGTATEFNMARDRADRLGISFEEALYGIRRQRARVVVDRDPGDETS